MSTVLVKQDKKIKVSFKEKMSFNWKMAKQNKQVYVMLAPYMTLFTLFTVVPVVVSMVLGLTYFNLLEPPQFRGWMNYIRLFLEDELFMIAVKNTLLFAAITGPLSYMIAYLLAWFINDLGPKLRTFLTFVFYAPSLSGNMFLVWLWMFSGDARGIINGWLLKYGFVKEPIQWLIEKQFIMPIIIIVALWMSLGVGFLAFIAGLQGVDKTLYEAGVIDGVKNRWQELWFITLPSMKHILLFGAIMQITGSFAFGPIAAQLAGNPSTDYIAHTVILHLQDYGSIRYEMGYAAAIAFVLFCTMIFIQRLVQKLINKVGE